MQRPLHTLGLGDMPLLPQVVAMRAKRTPDKVYLRHVDGRTLTFAEADRLSHLWAGGLETLGVIREDVIALMLPNGFDIPMAWIGSAWLGAAVSPINPAYRGNLLLHALRTSGAKLLVTTAAAFQWIPADDLATTAIETVVFVDGAPDGVVPGIAFHTRDRILEHATVDHWPGPEPHDVAACIFTSGTTGPSKAVRVHWAQMFNTSSDGTLDEISAEDIYYSPLPMFHLTGLGPVYRMALAGGEVVIREILSISEYFNEIRKFGATSAVVMESMMQMLMKADPTELSDLPLRKVICVPVPPYIDEFKERLGVSVATMYNMTELSVPICSDGFNVTAADAGSCGRLRDCYEAIVADPLDYPVPDGEIGELLVRPKLPWITTTGYQSNAEASAESWRNGWFHTGDAFRRDSAGRYFFVDRIKDAIRRRGENISTSEVETEVIAWHQVAECAVVPHKAGETEEVKVFVVPRDEATFDPAELIAFLIPRMTHFMIPRFVETIASLPRTPSQKIQKHILRAMGNSERTWDREAAGIVVRAPRNT